MRWLAAIVAVVLVAACGNEDNGDGGNDPEQRSGNEGTVEEFPQAIPGGLDQQPAWMLTMGRQPTDPGERSVSVEAVESTFAALDHSTGKLTFFDAATGRKITEHDAVPEDPGDALLSTVDDRGTPAVVVRFWRSAPAQGLNPESRPRMTKVFDAAGELVWESGPNEEFHTDGWIVHTEESEQNSVHTIRDRDGNDVWSFNEREFDGGLEYREPRYFHDNLVAVQYGGGLDHGFAVHDLSAGNSTLWERHDESVFFGFYDGIALAQHGRSLTAHDPRTGGELWSLEAEPFGDDGYRPAGWGVYNTEHGILLLGYAGAGNHATAVDVRNGKLLWSQQGVGRHRERPRLGHGRRQALDLPVGRMNPTAIRRPRRAV